MTPDQRQGGNGSTQAAVLFVAAGIIGLVGDGISGLYGEGQPLAVALDLLNIGIGIITRLLPWGRWPRRAELVLPTLALANLSLNITIGFVTPATEAVWLVLVFVWIGQWQPPRAAITMAPLAGAAYALPFCFGVPATSDAVIAVMTGIPLAVLVGETIARKERASRLARVGQSEALALLAAANLTDDLTGLGNRRRANMLLDSLAEGDALAILDLDHFKRVNDELGHQEGDHVLQQLGAFLRSAVREADDVARFGGEEFIVVLRASVSAPVAVIQRLLDGWRATQPPCTLSAGVAVHGGEVPASATFAHADAALYRAKAQGRDRLVMHPLEGQRQPTSS